MAVKTNKEMLKDIKTLEAQLKEAKSAFEMVSIENSKLTSDFSNLENACRINHSENIRLSNQIGIAESELHRRDAMPPFAAINAILDKCDLVDQIFLLNQVCAIKAVDIRKAHAEHSNQTKYLSNVLEAHERNMANIANGTTVQPS